MQPEVLFTNINWYLIICIIQLFQLITYQFLCKYRFSENHASSLYLPRIGKRDDRMGPFTLQHIHNV